MPPIPFEALLEKEQGDFCQPELQSRMEASESYSSEVFWLVVWLPFFIFPYIGNFIIPIDFHIFQRGGPGPPTRFGLEPGLVADLR